MSNIYTLFDGLRTMLIKNLYLYGKLEKNNYSWSKHGKQWSVLCARLAGTRCADLECERGSEDDEDCGEQDRQQAKTAWSKKTMRS